MAITQVWDSAYENIPADNDQASEGALRIRNLKRDVRERAEVDHDWDDTTDAGKHLQVVFKDPLGADPGDVADEGILYTKNVSAKAELFWKDEDGNVMQLTTVGAAAAAFPFGTRMVFQQAAAPTSWTKDTTAALDDHSLRVVTSTVFTSGSVGGATAFTSVFGSGKTTGSYTLLAADIPGHIHTIAHTHTMAHTHAQNANTVLATGAAALGPSSSNAATRGGTTGGSSAGSTGGSSAANSGSVGGSGGHTHTSSLDLKYLDLIMASKD